MYIKSKLFLVEYLFTFTAQTKFKKKERTFHARGENCPRPTIVSHSNLNAKNANVSERMSFSQ